MAQDALSLHKKFIDECYNWLEAAMIPFEGSVVSHTLLQATKLLTSLCVPQGSLMPSPSRYNFRVLVHHLHLYHMSPAHAGAEASIIYWPSALSQMWACVMLCYIFVVYYSGSQWGYRGGSPTAVQA